MKIGIYGGSFDPVHNGHIYVAESAIKQCELDELRMMPSYNSPNKSQNQMTDSIHRIKMCELAAQHNPKIIIDDYEARREEISYTYLTMLAYKEKFASDELYYILGADSLDYFDHWVHPEIIAECAKIVVIPRIGFSKAQMEEKAKEIQQQFKADIIYLDIEEYTASSSNIKQFLKNNRAHCPSHLNSLVFDYIKKHQLYI